MKDHVSTLNKKFRKAVNESLEETKHLYLTQLPSALAESFRKIGYTGDNYHNLDGKTFDVSEDLIHIFKEEVANVFFGGCEPEFETIEQYEKYQMIKAENFHFSNNQTALDTNPYQDKKKPYLQWRTVEIAKEFKK